MSEGNVLLVLPSMRISGGVIEAVRLASELVDRGLAVSVLSLWRHTTELNLIDSFARLSVPVTYLSNVPAGEGSAFVDFFRLLPRYFWHLRTTRKQKGSDSVVIMTHYSTLPFGLFSAKRRRICFVQDEEWLFVRPGILRFTLRSMILFFFNRSRIVTSNPYITRRFVSFSIVPVAEARIWADDEYGDANVNGNRPIDVVMVLRHGSVKRLDLYLQFLLESKRVGVRSRVITCEQDIGEIVSKMGVSCSLRPTNLEMRSIFEQSKIFVLLSEREGFGLPPLEAMGAGCVPFCRNSGGVQSYMVDALAENLLPLDMPVDEIVRRVGLLLEHPRRLVKLSTEARRIFLTGRAETKQARSHALDVIEMIARSEDLGPALPSASL